MLRVLFECLCRRNRPDIMISRRQEEAITAIRRQRTHDLLPFGVGGQVVSAFNGVSYGDDEIGMVSVRFTPSCLIHPRNRSACSVAKNDEVELIAGTRVSRETSHSDDDENGQDPHVAAI